MKVIPEQRDLLIKLGQERSKIGQDVGTIRVDLKQIEQLHHEAKNSVYTIQVDEPKERGGTGLAPAPLGYFLLGAVSCFSMQMARTAIERNYKIDDIEITARAHYDRGKLRKFLDLIYDVNLVGSESKENVIDLLYESEKLCFVHQTLKDCIPLTSNVILNGTQLVSHSLGPE
ncbi:MAG: OsmC-related (seleno)protein [Nitrososphaerales archaeon]